MTEYAATTSFKLPSIHVPMSSIAPECSQRRVLRWKGAGQSVVVHRQRSAVPAATAHSHWAQEDSEGVTTHEGPVGQGTVAARVQRAARLIKHTGQSSATTLQTTHSSSPRRDRPTGRLPVSRFLSTVNILVKSHRQIHVRSGETVRHLAQDNFKNTKYYRLQEPQSHESHCCRVSATPTAS